jgi:hypothetical protein
MVKPVEELSVSVFPSDAVQVNPAAIQVDASIVGQGLELEPSEVQSLMREGAITSSCERGIEDDAGRYRLIFFYKSRRLRLISDEAGRVIQRSTIEFGNRPLPARLHRRVE